MKKVSIKDVAQLSGVSITAVSHIINGKGERFSDETVQKVLKARDELGYVANHAAKTLKGSSSKLIGVIVPSFRLPFFSDLIQSMESQAPENVHLVFFTATDETLGSAIQSLVERGVDALIFGRPIPQEVTENNLLQKQNIPFLVLDQNDDQTAQDRIVVNERQGGQMLAEHFYELGHQKVAILTPQTMTGNMNERREGFLRRLDERDIKLVADITTTLSKHGGLNATQAVIDSGATAVFCLNDEMAIGLIRGLASSGVKVPGEVSVAGYDDNDYAEFIVPRLTTVAQPVFEIGETALKLILSRLSNPNQLQQTVHFKLHLVKRESTGEKT
jgi:LacI family transcriptional regulator